MRLSLCVLTVVMKGYRLFQSNNDLTVRFKNKLWVARQLEGPYKDISVFMFAFNFLSLWLFLFFSHSQTSFFPPLCLRLQSGVTRSLFPQSLSHCCLSAFPISHNLWVIPFVFGCPFYGAETYSLPPCFNRLKFKNSDYLFTILAAICIQDTIQVIKKLIGVS